MKIVREHINEIVRGKSSAIEALGIGKDFIKKQILDEIENWKAMYLRNKRCEYFINEDLIINVDTKGEELYINTIREASLPEFIKFGTINGDFRIASQYSLNTLKGCPTTVIGNFTCNENILKSLEFAPDFVRHNFNCSDNKLTSLEFLPRGIQGDLNFAWNQIENLIHCPRKITGNFNMSNNMIDSLWCGPEIVEGDFNMSHNYITSLKDCPKKVTGDFYCRNNPTKFTHIMVKKAGCEVGGTVRFKSDMD